MKSFENKFELIFNDAVDIDPGSPMPVVREDDDCNSESDHD